MQGEMERILAISDPAARIRAYAELRRTMDDGEAMPAEVEGRVLRSLSADAAPAGREEHRAMAAASWDVERRRLVALHTARTLAPVGIGLAALAPFVTGAWRAGMGLWGTLAAFLAPGPALAGVALAAVAAGVLARFAGRADTFEGLAGLVVAAFAAGMAGLAVALGLVF